MKKILLITLFLLLPNIAFGAFGVGWNATSTTQGWISPNRVNGVEQDVVADMFIATSTVGASRFPYASSTALTAGTIFVGDGGAGTLKGDSNLIKCASASCFTNIKGGTGFATISLGNNAVSFYTGNSSGDFDFRTGATASTNTGTSRFKIFQSGGVSLGDSFIATDPGADILIVEGNTGIGSSTPGAKLGVSGAANGNVFQLATVAHSPLWTWTDSGRMGGGTTSPMTTFAIESGLAAPIIISGNTPNIRYLLHRPSGGFAFSLMENFAQNDTTGLTTYMGGIGLFGNLQSGVTAPTPSYMYAGVDSCLSFNTCVTQKWLPAQVVGFPNRVSIGTDTMTNLAMLHISSSTPGTTALFRANTASVANEIDSNGRATWPFASSTALTVSGNTYLNGFVAISSSSPFAKFSLTHTGTEPTVVVEDTTSPDTSPWFIDANGNWMIGSTTPNYTATDKFVVNVGTRSFSVNASGNGTYLKDEDGGGSAQNYGFKGSGGTDVGGYGAFVSGDALVRYYTGTFSTGELMSILLNGNVGIATTSPYAKLSVVGEVVMTNFNATSTTATSTIAGPLDLGSTGTSPTVGNATLVAGTVTVVTGAVTTNSFVMLTRKTSGGTIGTAITYTLANGSFTINSDNPLDTSVFTWLVIN